MTVTEDIATGGQNLDAALRARHGFPQVIHSAKRFAGPTGLEEYVGCGIGMALTIHVKRRSALIFRAAHYFLQLRPPLRCRAWLTPGRALVTHAELGDGRFSFTLQITHPRFGLLHPPDRHLPGGRNHDSQVLWTLIAIQIAMAAFDTHLSPRTDRAARLAALAAA